VFSGAQRGNALTWSGDWRGLLNLQWPHHATVHRASHASVGQRQRDRLAWRGA